jgi:hypothetical protein
VARDPAMTTGTASRYAEQLERAAEFFRERDSYEGVLVRRVFGEPTSYDRELADHLVRERRRRSRMDGSIAGSLVLTARALWEIMELGADAEHAGVVRLSGYLLSQQDLPGRWSEDGMAGDGFFSPGPRHQPIAPLVLRSGTVFENEMDARFVASCLAMRGVLRAGHENRAPVRAHLERLLSLKLNDPRLAFVVLGAVGHAPPSYLPRIGPLLDETARGQLPDGTWPGVTVFHAVDLLMSVPNAQARALVARAAAHIASLQTASGAFDPTDNQALALIAVRALEVARGV